VLPRKQAVLCGTAESIIFPHGLINAFIVKIVVNLSQRSISDFVTDTPGVLSAN
jgi:hypothetical protein